MELDGLFQSRSAAPPIYKRLTAKSVLLFLCLGLYTP